MTKTPLKHLVGLNELTLGEDTDPERIIRYLDIGSVATGVLVDEPKTMSFAEAPSRARRLVREGDTIVSTVRTYLRAVWPVQQSADGLVVSTGFAVLTPRTGLDPGYLGWIAQSNPFVDAIVARSVGVSYPAVSPSEIGEICIDLPPLVEQRAIADYLDTETTRIDALVAKKQALSTRLLERYASQRSETLLRGLDPVDGSGALPNGWRVGSLAAVARLQRGLDLPDSARRPGPVPIVSSGGRSGWHDIVGIRGPGVITGRYGTIGTVYWEPNGFWPLNTTLYVRDFAGNDPRWVYHLLAAVPLDLDSAKSAVTGINRNVVGQLRVPIPPLDDQQRLAAQLDADFERCGRSLAALDQQLALIREHRQALITAAVTGKLEIPRMA